MSEPNIRIAITGATGYVGSRLCQYFKDLCGLTIQLTSNPEAANPSLPYEKFSLTDGVRKGFFAENKVDVLVHAAYDFRPKSRKDIWRVNVAGSIALFKQARAEGVERILVISTMSAYEGCRSLYGNAKLEIEAALSDGLDTSCVRPGLIYSTPLDQSRGMIGSILTQVKSSNILPLIGGGKQELYLTHEEDLGRFCYWLATRPSATVRAKYFITANPKPYLFREIVELVSITTNRTNVKLISVPWRSVWLGIKSLEAIRVSTKFRSDSVLSLAYQQKHPDFSTVPPEFVFRDFSEAIHKT
jgi:nucleoside-diphosphate-sugar epimerase